MRRICILASLLSVLAACSGEKPQSGYPIDPIPFTAVKVTDSFWGQRLEASRKVTVPLAFSKCEETGRYDNFVRAVHPDSTYRIGGFPFDDTDVYKTIEGASYLLQTSPNPALEAYIDSVLTIVAAAQEPDGYLNTARQMNPWHPHSWVGDKRWSVEEVNSHELYNLGHMIEGAVAHYQATGKRNFLDIAIKYADCVCREVGLGEGQADVIPGHEIAEMALAKLYLATGDRKYLDQAVYFVERRGKTGTRNTYIQSHKPILEQDEAVGHAVRAEYLYSGVADVAALTGMTDYIEAIDRIWENIATRKLYITGGVGARHAGEAFGDDYELPNESAYCETCAAIGNVYFNYRMFLLHGESKYFDVLERTLYNALISGVSLDGGSFFYPNPLECRGAYERQPWFGCACCPSNICRFIPSLPGYVYAVKDDRLYVNLYVSDTATLEVGGKRVDISQKTGYPWSGDIDISIGKAPGKEFAMMLRIPGWVRGEVTPGDLYRYADGKDLGYGVEVNGEAVSAELQDGYFVIRRRWKAGDKVSLHLDMEPRRVVADDAIEADRGRICFERGPVVYCAEWPDNEGVDILDVKVPSNGPLEVEECPGLLGGVNRLVTGLEGEGKLTLIPYYAWAHRGPGAMSVWIKTAE